MATIYGLTCTATGKVYVGCTSKVAKRMREHLSLLRRGLHAEPDLQKDFTAYGEASFRIFPLKEIPEASLLQKREAELGWMDAYANLGLLYNRNRTSFAPTKDAIAKGQPRATATEGRKRSTEANQKRRLAQLGKPKGHGAKISATKRAKRVMR
jgi:group I intron endonuclease|tara:strand:+ start:195 stop:656 length:462 start_codon:yes stop_codon:yes gene_type:complete